MNNLWKPVRYKTFVPGILIPVFLAGASSAATLTVSNTSDSGAGSLRSAISSAASGDTVNFNLTYPATITLTSGTLAINQSLTLAGPGSSNLTISGNSLSRVFSIAGGVDVSLANVTISNGQSTTLSGGGIYNLGNLKLTNSVISGNAGNNTPGPTGGGIYNGNAATIINCIFSGNSSALGGAIDNHGTMTLTNSTVSGNSGTSDFGGSAGGIYNFGTLAIDGSLVSGNSAGIGGGIFNDGTMTLTNSTVSGNSAHGNSPGEAAYGGGIENFGTMTLTGCTVSGNSVTGFSSGRGGGIDNSSGTLTLINTTVSGNSARAEQQNNPGGGGISNQGTLILSKTTVSGNSLLFATAGAGANIISYSGATLEVKRSIFANGAGNCSISANSVAISDGYNLSDDGTCSAFLFYSGDMNNTPAGLDPNGLQDNGGPTQTIALLSGSPAVDAVPVGVGGVCAGDEVTSVVTDQRGVLRPQGSSCDIGAFELTSSAALLSITKYQATGFALGQQGASYTLTVSNAASAGPTSGTVTVSDPLPSGLTLVSMSGAGWSCTNTTCSRGESLQPGLSYPAIAVVANVAANAVSPLVNTASVSGGGSSAASATASTFIDGAPLLRIAKTHTGSFALGQQGAYTLTVSNAVGAGPTSGTVTVTDNTPAGLSIVSMSGTGWSCANNTCSRSEALGAGASYPAITATVSVAAHATSPQINTATVSGGGWASANVADFTTISGVPVLSLSEVHNGAFNLGQQASYTLTVANAASAGPTSGTVLVTDALPSGLTLITMGGTGWLCAGSTCSRSDPLNAGSTYPAITVTVSVAPHATTPQINSAFISGGGSAPASLSDSTTIAGAPVLNMHKYRDTGNFVVGQQGRYILAIYSSPMTGPTSGTVTVTDPLPSGLSLVSMSGDGWSCTNTTCTRSDVLPTGATYPGIFLTVNIAANAPASLVNTAYVSGGSSLPASGSDSGPVSFPSLLLTKTHTGNFMQGQQGATYNLAVSNTAAIASTIGTVTVSEFVPAGLTLVSMTGAGWSCTTSACSRSDPLMPGGKYSPITVAVNVSPTAPSSVTNVAVVSGGGATTYSASDVTTISPPVYTISGSVTSAGAGLSGVTVALSGTFSGSTVTDAGGNYSFNGLFNGGTYTLSAALTGYSFSAPVTFTNLSANQTANFTGTPLTNCIGMFSTLTNLVCSSISQSGYKGGLGESIGAQTSYFGAMTLVGNVPFGDAAGMALYNAGGGLGASVSVDLYNTPANGGIPQAKIKAIDDGNYSDHLTFWTKTPGSGSNPVTEKLRIASNGNVGIGVMNPTFGPLQMSSGAYVTAGGVWINASDRNLKENFVPVLAGAILQEIDALPLLEWNYKNEDPSVRHIGPVAQDFYSIFGVGNSSTAISTIDPSGIALAGIQGLDEKSRGRAARLAELKKELAASTEELRSLQERLAHVESLLNTR